MPLKQMNRSQKEKLKEKIEKLDAQEHEQLFHMIQRYTQSYTKTQQSVLVSSDVLPDECLFEIEKMVHYFLDQRVKMNNENGRKAIQ